MVILGTRLLAGDVVGRIPAMARSLVNSFTSSLFSAGLASDGRVGVGCATGDGLGGEGACRAVGCSSVSDLDVLNDSCVYSEFEVKY